MQSPSDRNRITATRLSGASRSMVPVCVATSFRPALIVDSRFVNQHDRNTIVNRVEAVARNAPQPAVVRLELHFGPACRTYQNFEKISAYRHVFLNITFA